MIFCYTLVRNYGRRQYNRGQWLSRLVSLDYDFFDYGSFAPANRITSTVTTDRRATSGVFLEPKFNPRPGSPGPAAGLARREFGGPVAGVQCTFVGALVSRGRVDGSINPRTPNPRDLRLDRSVATVFSRSRDVNDNRIAKRVRARNNAQRACHNDNNRCLIGWLTGDGQKRLSKRAFRLQNGVFR